MAAVDLGTLPPAKAAQLLLEICPRIGELARLCGYLALALRLAASFLANSTRAVPRYLEQLAAERRRGECKLEPRPGAGAAGRPGAGSRADANLC